MNCSIPITDTSCSVSINNPSCGNAGKSSKCSGKNNPYMSTMDEHPEIHIVTIKTHVVILWIVGKVQVLINQVINVIGQNHIQNMIHHQMATNTTDIQVALVGRVIMMKHLKFVQKSVLI